MMVEQRPLILLSSLLLSLSLLISLLSSVNSQLSLATTTQQQSIITDGDVVVVESSINSSVPVAASAEACNANDNDNGDDNNVDEQQQQQQQQQQRVLDDNNDNGGGRDEEEVDDEEQKIIEMGVPQNLEFSQNHAGEMKEALQRARGYVANFNNKVTTAINTHPSSSLFRSLHGKCKNHHELCTYWAVVMGECQTNPMYMNLTCAPLCHACEYLAPELRCPIDPHAIDAWYPGDLHQMFQRITTHADYQQYQPTILSSPPIISDTSSTNINTNNNETIASHPADELSPSSPLPWIVQLDNFLSPQEAHRFIELGTAEGYQVTHLASRRDEWTFDNVYCNSEVCEDNATIQAVLCCLEDLTQIPQNHYEHFSLLRYQTGQYANIHLDYIAIQHQRQEGVRILSVLIYLNHVEQAEGDDANNDGGGQTNFPQLNITITPQPGRVVLWPSGLNDDPNSPDHRTDHQSLPVTKGVKYATYLAVHQRNYKAPLAMDCTHID